MVPHPLRSLLCCAIILAACRFDRAPAAEPDTHRTRSPWFDELSFTADVEPDVRMHVNSPQDDSGEPARGTRLVVFALPNGNTIEQTLGCRLTEGLDWHYDIQHVAAQVRLFRTLAPDEQVVLICAEAGGLSWPTWRASHDDANATIARLVDRWRQEFGTADAKVTLTGHSGGGSFMFGAIEGSDEIPAYVDRIAWLDANYAFAADTHAEKLRRWLTGDSSRRLIVVAYDDREITYNGKKVVGPTGGTFRATGRMRDALGPHFPLAESQQPPFTTYTGLDGRICCFVHPNSENKILHTALVGDMNGLVHVLTLGTPREEKWGTFGGPRAFTQWVQPEPTPPTGTVSASAPVSVPQSQSPPRPTGAIGGAEFVTRIAAFPLDDREAAIEREITGGNFPEFLRQFRQVPIRGTTLDGKEITASLAVMPDYLAVGSDADFVRLPMTPQTAQRIADQLGCLLPTRKMVDAIDAAAELHLAPHPLTEAREAVSTFLEHHQIIERQRAGKPLGLLITGIKKDVVLSPRLFERPNRLALYGWRKLDGQPIQPLTTVHWNRYVDYSHGARLVLNQIEVDGRKRKITDVLADQDLCSLMSDEGPIDPPRYPE